jgi:hypothetical protein
MEAISKSQVNGWTVEIHYDTDPGSPREWTHGCELVLSHRNYNLPNDAGVDFDAFGGWGDVAEHLKSAEGALMVLPVHGYDHGGLVLRAGSRAGQFGDPWDSGVAGLAYVTPQNWKDTQGTTWTGGEADQEQARKLIESDVDTYTQYLNGEVYGYTITDSDGEEVDSCWGYYGLDYVTSEAAAIAAGMEHEPKCTGTLNRRTGQLEHTGACPFHPEGND